MLNVSIVRPGSAPIVVAFSGGGDSTALLHMLCDELGPKRLVAGIVDHAVRAGSAAEAQLAARRAEALGVRARVLTLAWEEGAKRSQAVWRRRRYAALCALARELGASVIAVAHTADDQAETVLMRKQRKAEARALAGIAEVGPAPLWPEGRGVRIVRPLLGRWRAELREWLVARGAEWIEDPSNENLAYERIRARRALEGRPGEAPALVREALRLRAAAAALDRRAAEWVARRVGVREDRAILWSAPDPAIPRALSALIAAIAGSDSEPPADQVVALARRAATPGFAGATLGGARLSPNGEALELSRDPGGLLGRGKMRAQAWQALPPGEEFVWDGRLLVSAPGPGWRIAAAAGPPNPIAPVFGRGEAKLSLAEARAAGLEARWLIGAHLEHLLPLVHPPVSGAC